MADLINFYISNKEIINLIKDIVYFSGAYYVLRFIFNRNYITKTEQIEKDIDIREALDETLNNYILEKSKNGIQDISIRFVYWKNYPNDLNNDAFPNKIYIDYLNNKVILGSWIDKTGIYFQDDILFLSCSLYLDETTGIYFIDKNNLSYENFKEYKEVQLINHVPFKNILNFDFKNFIEYEPVFYTKYHYEKYKNLYSDLITMRKKNGNDYINKNLDRRLMIKNYSLWRYYLKKMHLLFNKKIRCQK